MAEIIVAKNKFYDLQIANGLRMAGGKPSTSKPPIGKQPGVGKPPADLRARLSNQRAAARPPAFETYSAPFAPYGYTGPQAGISPWAVNNDFVGDMPFVPPVRGFMPPDAVAYHGGRNFAPDMRRGARYEEQLRHTGDGRGDAAYGNGRMMPHNMFPQETYEDPRGYNSSSSDYGQSAGSYGRSEMDYRGADYRRADTMARPSDMGYSRRTASDVDMRHSGRTGYAEDSGRSRSPHYDRQVLVLT